MRTLPWLIAFSLGTAPALAGLLQTLSREDVLAVRQALSAHLGGTVDVTIEELIAGHVRSPETRHPVAICGIASYRTPANAVNLLFLGWSHAPARFSLALVEDRATGDEATRSACEAEGIYVNQ